MSADLPATYQARPVTTRAVPKLFALDRQQDVTGVSGTGTVAHGVQFADGQVVIRWLGEFASTVVWDSLAAAMAVHGHDGRTRVVWLPRVSGYPVRQRSLNGEPKPLTSIERTCKTCGASFLRTAPGRTGERGIWRDWRWYCSAECDPGWRDAAGGAG